MPKRCLCILLTLLVACAFFTACGKDGMQPSGEPDDGAEVSGNVEQTEGLGAREEKRVLGCWMTLADSTWQMMSDMLKALFEEGGYQYDAVSGEGDPLLQLEQIENAVVQGYDMIFVVPINGESIADACKAAMDAGVYVYAFMNDPINSTVYRTIDMGYAAQIQVQYAAEWVDAHFPDAEDGSINTVLIGQNYDSTTTVYWEAMQREAAKYPKLNVIEAVTIEESITDGQAKAENILTMHTDKQINLWICASPSGIIGVNAAIMSENSGVDYIEDCCLVGDVVNAETADLLRLSTTNESVLRLCAAKGGRLDTNLGGAYAECDKLLRGETVDAFSPVNVDLAGPDNLADFGYGEEAA